ARDKEVDRRPGGDVRMSQVLVGPVLQIEVDRAQGSAADEGNLRRHVDACHRLERDVPLVGNDQAAAEVDDAVEHAEVARHHVHAGTPVEVERRRPLAEQTTQQTHVAAQFQLAAGDRDAPSGVHEIEGTPAKDGAKVWNVDLLAEGNLRIG